MPAPLAVCVGLTTLDVIQRLASVPVPGRKSVSLGSELAAGGPAANAAVTCAALLGSATLVTAVGDGPAAALVRADLEAHGVRLLDCAPPGWALPVATCLVNEDGERTVVSPGAIASPVTLGAEGRAAVRRADGILLDGHHPLMARAALDARRAGSVCVLDAGSAKGDVETWLADFDVVACSADYAAGLGLPTERVADHVLAAGAGAVVLTDGAGPVTWCRAGEARPHALQPPVVRARDTLGAGDAFHGALLAGLLQPRFRLDSAVRLAADTASLRCAHVGARGWLSELAVLAVKE